MISWSATQTPGQPGPSMLLTLDLFAGTSPTTVASWQGGLFMDGLHAWSPDESSMAYVSSDAGAVIVGNNPLYTQRELNARLARRTFSNSLICRHGR